MNKEELFRIAEVHYSEMLKTNTFVSDPDYFRFPLQLPHYKTVFVTVNGGKIKQIEIHYENGGIQTIRPDPV